MFGEEPWFPRIPEPARGHGRGLPTLCRCRRRRGEAEDVHWAIQSELIDRLPIDHVGRLEQLDDTLALLREHVGGEHWPTEQRQENRTPRSAAAGRIRRGGRGRAERALRRGLRALRLQARRAGRGCRGHGEVERARRSAPPDHPGHDRQARPDRAAVPGRTPGAVRSRSASRPSSSRQLGHANSPILTNLENHTDFNVVWGWSEADTTPGFTAVVRAKNEADPLPWVLPPLFRAVERVVLVDNGSTDGTPEVARRVGGGVRREPSASRCTPIPSRSRAAARSTSAPRPSRCTASSTSTTGRSRTCARATR